MTDRKSRKQFQSAESRPPTTYGDSLLTDSVRHDTLKRNWFRIYRLRFLYARASKKKKKKENINATAIAIYWANGSRAHPCVYVCRAYSTCEAPHSSASAYKTKCDATAHTNNSSSHSFSFSRPLPSSHRMEAAVRTRAQSLDFEKAAKYVYFLIKLSNKACYTVY